MPMLYVEPVLCKPVHSPLTLIMLCFVFCTLYYIICCKCVEQCSTSKDTTTIEPQSETADGVASTATYTDCTTAATS